MYKNPLVLYIHVVLFVKSRKLYCALRHSKNVICQSYMIVSLKIFSHRVNWESFFKWHGKYSSIFKIMAKIWFFCKSFYRMQHINVFNELYKKWINIFLNETKDGTILSWANFSTSCLRKISVSQMVILLTKEFFCTPVYRM